jgi:hypothetical protein
VVDDAIPYGWAGTIGDVTGDGLADLAHSRSWESDMIVSAGDPLFTTHEGDTDGAWHSFSEHGSFMPMDGPYYAGDLNGDGGDDVLLIEYQVRIAGHYGPLDGPGGWTAAGGDSDEGYGSAYAGYMWWLTLSGTDIDGDGRADAVAVNYPMSETDQGYSIYFGGSVPFEPCPVRGDWVGLHVAALGAGTIGDGDGDGLTDLLFAMPSGVQAVSGADARLLCEATVDDLSVGWMDVTGVPLVMGTIGDWNGDGVSEWIASTGDQGVDEDSVYFWSADAAMRGDFDTSSALGSYLGSGSDEYFRFATTLQFDAEDTPNLLLTEGFTGAVHLLRGGVLPGLHDPLPERRLQLSTDGYLGSTCSAPWVSPCVGDFNGDGFDDMVVNYTTDDDSREIYILPGFEIPWDDDTMW